MICLAEEFSIGSSRLWMSSRAKEFSIGSLAEMMDE